MQNTYPVNPFEVLYIIEIIDIGKGLIPALTDENTLYYRLEKQGLQEALSKSSYLPFVNEIVVQYHLSIYTEDLYPSGWEINSEEIATESNPLARFGKGFGNDLTEISINFHATKTTIKDKANNKGLENDGDYEPNFTARSLVTKQFVENRTVINGSTTALSAADLNTAYPTANTGFKVQCKSILAGGLIYEKSGTGWIQYAIVTVT